MDFKKIADGLRLIADGIDSTCTSVQIEEKPKAEKPKAEKPKAEKPKAEKPKAEKPKAEKPKAEKPKAEKPNADYVRKLMVEKCSSIGREKVKEVLSTLNATNFTAVKEEDYSEFVKKLEELD